MAYLARKVKPDYRQAAPDAVQRRSLGWISGNPREQPKGAPDTAGIRTVV